MISSVATNTSRYSPSTCFSIPAFSLAWVHGILACPKPIGILTEDNLCKMYDQENYYCLTKKDFFLFESGYFGGDPVDILKLTWVLLPSFNFLKIWMKSYFFFLWRSLVRNILVKFFHFDNLVNWESKEGLKYQMRDIRL